MSPPCEYPVKITGDAGVTPASAIAWATARYDPASPPAMAFTLLVMSHGSAPGASAGSRVPPM
jgi:hypothetical protein